MITINDIQEGNVFLGKNRKYFHIGPKHHNREGEHYYVLDHSQPTFKFVKKPTSDHYHASTADITALARFLNSKEYTLYHRRPSGVTSEERSISTGLFSIDDL